MYLYYLLAACGPQLQPYLWWKRFAPRTHQLWFHALASFTAQDYLPTFFCPRSHSLTLSLTPAHSHILAPSLNPAPSLTSPPSLIPSSSLTYTPSLTPAPIIPSHHALTPAPFLTSPPFLTPAPSLTTPHSLMEVLIRR